MLDYLLWYTSLFVVCIHLQYCYFMQESDSAHVSCWTIAPRCWKWWRISASIFVNTFLKWELLFGISLLRVENLLVGSSVCMYSKFVYIIWNNHLKEYFLLERSWALLSFTYLSMRSSLMEMVKLSFQYMEVYLFFLLPCRLMTVMSFPCNSTLIVRMENIYHPRLIGMSAIFTHFIGNVVVMAAAFVARLRGFLLGLIF